MSSDTLQGMLQTLSNTTLDACGAANVLAGTSGLELVGALNVWAGTQAQPRELGYLRDRIVAASAAPVPSIGITLLTEGKTTTDATSFTTASITLTANRLGLVFLAIGKTGGAVNHATITGWTEVSFDQQGAGNTAHQVLRRLAGTDATGALTIDFGANTQGAISWHVVEVTGILTTGTNGANAVAEVVTGEGTGTGTVSLTGVTSGNATVGGMSMGSSVAANFTGFTGWTQLGTTQASATPSCAGAVGWKQTGTTDMSLVFAGGQAWSGAIIELAHA